MAIRSNWKYNLLPSIETVENLTSALDLSPITAQLLVSRGINTLEAAKAFLSPANYPPTPLDQMPDLVQASTRLQTAVKTREKVLIWGDFDTDGLSSTAIMADALRSLGILPQVHIAKGHGIGLVEFKRLYAEFSPTLVVVCDTGSNALLVADYAKNQHIDLIIIDHHILPEKHLEVTALVNPVRLPATHPFKTLTTAGIAYLLVEHLFEALDLSHETLLELVALGLLADSTPLLGETRYLVQRSLEQLRQSQRPGLLALAAVNAIDLEVLSVEDIAFRLAPCLNAFGRLDQAYKGFQLLTTHDSNEANLLATQADALNQKRKLLTRQMLKAIYEQLENDPNLARNTALVLHNPRWEAGVISAVAGQLAQEYGRPVALLITGQDGVVRGSARSAGGYDLPAALAALEDILIGYGGHLSAAGFSLYADNLTLFPRRFSNALALQKPATNPDELLVAAELPFNELTLKLVQDIERLAPFGNGNPRPVFVAHRLKKLRSAKLGRSDQHRRLALRDETGVEKAVFWWNSSHFPMPDGIIDLAYQVTPLRTATGYELQLMWVDWLQVEAPPDPTTLQPDLIDCRARIDLEAIRAQEPALMIWAEGYSQAQSLGVTFSELAPAEALVIYTAPANPASLEKALKKVHPQRIYVYGAVPPFETAPKLLEALAALLRTALKQFEGKIRLTQLAERTAHSPETIKLALHALKLDATWLNQNTLEIKQIPPPAPFVTTPQLDHALSETAAYRRFLQRTDLENILP